MDTLKIGIIGCGMISKTYFEGIAAYDGVEVAGCADIREEAARQRAKEFNVPFRTVEDLLADPEIEVVVNLTIPAAHAEVNTRILEAGKHPHCEKPFANTLEDGKNVLALAREKGLGVGCAPDTFLGSGQQTARALLDSGAIGEPRAGQIFFVSGGHDLWHTNPAFYYQPGGGPLFDMGPYYITALINLLGPAKSVMAYTARALKERQTTHGGLVPVNVNTHYNGTIEFQNGVLINAVFSFDCPGGANLPFIEIYGSEGTLSAPDPNNFDGENKIRRGRRTADDPKMDWEVHTRNFTHFGNRGVGPIDLGKAMRNNRPIRASGELGYHALEIMAAFDTAGETHEKVEIESTCERPDPLPENLPSNTWPE